MDRSTARAAIDAVLRSARRHAYRALGLKYAGGEPLLNPATLLEAHRYASERAAAFGIALQASVLSNGAALTPALAEQLRELGIGLTISLDGLGASNDAQRPSLAGRGSARLARRAIELALATGLRPAVAITVSAASLPAAPELVRWLLERELAFTVSFARPFDQAGADGLPADEERIVAGMRALYAEVDARPPAWSVLGALLDRADLARPHNQTCAAGNNYLVIDQRGQVAACQMELARPVSTVAAADPLLELRAARGAELALGAGEKEGCRTCEWRYWCAGGCPIATFKATGRYDLCSPNCAIYKALYPDLIRLEGRRLLQRSTFAPTI